MPCGRALMGARSPVLRSVAGGRIGSWCPGRGEPHVIPVGGGDGPRWGCNGNAAAPTFTPWILVRGVRFGGSEDQRRRIIDSDDVPADRERMLADRRITPLCHSLVTDGRVQYWADCTHALAGQRVDLPPLLRPLLRAWLPPWLPPWPTGGLP